MCVVDVAYCYRQVALSVCHICHSVTAMSSAKMANSSRYRLGCGLRWAPRNHVLDWGADPPWQGAILRGKGSPL